MLSADAANAAENVLLTRPARSPRYDSCGLPTAQPGRLTGIPLAARTRRAETQAGSPRNTEEHTCEVHVLQGISQCRLQANDSATKDTRSELAGAVVLLCTAASTISGRSLPGGGGVRGSYWDASPGIQATVRGHPKVHRHAPAMLMAWPSCPEIESVVGDGSCRLSVWSSGAAGSMEPWRLCRGGSESVPR